MSVTKRWDDPPCYLCGKPVTAFQSQYQNDKGNRHLHCPKTGGKVNHTMDQKRISWQLSQSARIKKILDILTKIEEDSTSKRGYRPTLEERQKIRGTLVQAAEKLVNALTPKEPLGFTFEDEVKADD